MSNSLPPYELEIGLILNNRYQIQEIINKGDERIICRAMDLALARTVAIKIIASSDKEEMKRFIEEARAIANITQDLNDPHVIEVYDCGTTEQGIPYMVMGYLEGKNLREKLDSSQKLLFKEVVDILKPIIEVVGKIHEKGIIHKDINPANIVLTPTEAGQVPTLIDFGFASEVFLGKSISIKPSDNSSRRASDYMSPEQAEGLPLDKRSDIYSLATILYELLAGKLPSRINPELLYQLEQCKDIKPAFSFAIDRALSKNPSHRQNHCQQFLDELGEEFSTTSLGSETDVEPIAKRAMINNKMLVSVPLIAGVIGAGVRLLLSLGFGSFLYKPHITSMEPWIPFLQGFWGASIGAFLIVLVLRPLPNKEPSISLTQVFQLIAAGFVCGLLIFFSISNFVPPVTLTELGWEKYKYACILTCVCWGVGLAGGIYSANRYVTNVLNDLELLRKQLLVGGVGAILSTVLAIPILAIYYSIANSATVENLWPRTISDMLVQTISVCGVLVIFYWQNKRYSDTFVTV